ncbi:DUF1365 domain-containing protein [Segeticoccus rhizosphaerae]|uniref:DUF1365 domain-containing protein n=1 Tax=Segeticoccus rhizosphaerae TaxID=1104777 RepID=UPI001EF0FED9|nr:DUF1365 domain-containing protein [Segeticoccus rhizosphaerae]
MSGPEAAQGPSTADSASVPGLTALPDLPALVGGRLTHHRFGAVRYSFRSRVYQWLVDLDDVPRQPWYLRALARFDHDDHFGAHDGDDTLTIKAKVERFLAVEGVDLGAGSRILMLANARVLGHVFDPLTVHWCFTGEGDLACVVAEVHNTYGERHAYLLRPDRDGRATTDKAFYVSPFFDVTGSYRLRFTLSHDRVAVSVALHRDGANVFSAAFAGRPEAASGPALVRYALRYPLMPQRVSALIRIHGIRLWLRRLPIQPRPPQHPQEGV